MSKPQGTFKLKVKVDGQEFEAEGHAGLVSRQFEAFRLMIQGADQTSIRRINRPGTERRVGGAAPEHMQAKEDDHPVDLAKLFQVSPRNQSLSLRHTPGGKYAEADAVLLLLLGHKELRNEEDVPVTVLTEALKQSGRPVKRLDRILHLYADDRSILRSGRGKGGRYRLTNVGLKKAGAIAAQLQQDSAER